MKSIFSIFLALALLSSCATAQRKFKDCNEGNDSACFALAKKCRRGDAEACEYVGRLSEEKSRGIANYEPGPNWMERNGPAVGEGLKRLNENSDKNQRQLTCIQTGACN